MTDIFGSSFNKDTFTNFVDEFLPDFERDEHPVDTTGILKKVNQIGKSNACNLSVFEVSIDETDAEKRIAITQNAFRMLRRHRVRNALIAFHYQSDNWRLSLLTSTLEIKDGKIVSKSSNPRRYSYLLGADAKVNTPRKFLMKQGRVSDIKELQERFSVDVVNKEFYNSVAECFMELVGGERGEGRKSQKFVAALQLPSLDKKEMQEFSVRLIGRIMFCWFLKEKKSPNGEPLMPSELLSLDAVSKNSDYYHNILEPLFFGCLNTRINKRVDDLKEEPFNQIPYLNGGLFSPQSTDYYKQNDINGRGTPGLVKIPDEWFTKLFNVLNQYNFTVDENTSFDIDLSIDPEMLGRIFENLLAEINPETGKTARSATGSFYTPREIVDYMVDNSIFEYLKSKSEIQDKKLKALISYGKEDDEESPLTDNERDSIVDILADLTILDPACGSGAFPMGILQKIFYMLQQVDPDGKKWYEKQIENIPSEELKKDLKSKFEKGNYDYIRKLGVIRQSIFGVDIQTIATEIAKLRCFLTLIIEEQVDDSKENRGIHPLPNLDFKFVAANSLVGLPGNNMQAINLFDNNEHIDTLKKIRNEYFTADENERMLLRARFAELQNDMFRNRISTNNATSYKYNALTEWRPFDNTSVPWFDSEWMFGIRSFDIVIGNPPYVQVKKETIPSEQYPYSAKKDKGKQNLYKVFIEHGYNVAADDGIVCYIVQSSLMCDLSASGTRELLLSRNNLLQIVEFPKKADDSSEQVFESVLQGTCICLFRKRVVPTSQTFKISNDNTIGTLSKIKFAEISYSDIRIIYPGELYIPLIHDTSVVELLRIIGHNKRFNSLILEAQQGDFNLGNDKKHFGTTKTPVLMYRGNGFQKYTQVYNTNKQGEQEFILGSFKQDRVDQNDNNEFLIGHNISGTTDANRLVFTIAPKGKYLCGDSINKYLLKDQTLNKCMLGILNSKLLDWIFRKTSTNNHVNSYEVEALPVPSDAALKSQTAAKVASLTQTIMHKKSIDQPTTKEEAEIDELICDLYEIEADKRELIQ